MLRRAVAALFLMLLGIAGASLEVRAQELAPRAYWPAPTGTNLLNLAYRYTTGDVVTDPSLPITGVDSSLNVGMFSYVRTFALAGRTANIQFSMPYIWGTVRGDLAGEARRRYVAGWADTQVRLSVNLLGAPAMNLEEFREMLADPSPLLGVSLQIQAPTGAYDPEKLINNGSNRWGAKPAVGLIYPLGRRWFAEGELGVWLIADNDDFLGVTREQDPIFATDLHLIRTFGTTIWLSFDLNYYYGGRSTIDNELSNDLQRNSRTGVTLVYPIRRGHLFRGSYSTGAVTSSGGDYEILTIGYLRAWK